MAQNHVPQFTVQHQPTQNQVHQLAVPAQQQLQQQATNMIQMPQHIPLNVQTMPQLHAQQQQIHVPQAYAAQPQPQTPAPHTPFPPHILHHQQQQPQRPANMHVQNIVQPPIPHAQQQEQNIQQPPQPQQPVEANINQQPRRADRIDTLPKTLKFDGLDSWKAFQQKFTRFSEIRNWRPQESRDYLGWCLEGRASEYYATIISQDGDIGFGHLMQKMEKRFGYKEIPETAQLKINSLSQESGERLEEWADRVFQLALRAYEGLPEDYMLKQAIKRICHGCTDKEAGQYAINLHPLTIEETIDNLKSFQYNHYAIYGKGRRDIREVTVCGEDAELSACSHATVAQVRPPRSQGEGVTQRMTKLEDQMGSLASSIEAVMKKMEALVRERPASPQRFRFNRSPQRNFERTRSPSRSPSPDLRCFHCGGTGHFRSACPSLKALNKPSKSVSFEDGAKPEGNDKGSGH